jgi:hypothetical protein
MPNASPPRQHDEVGEGENELAERLQRERRAVLQLRVDLRAA